MGYNFASPTIQEFPGSCHRLPLSAWNLDTRGIYIYDDGFKFVVLFGMILLPELAVNLLEKGFTTGFSKVSFSEQVNQTARNLMSILEKLREDNGSCYQLPCIVKQGEFILTNLNKDPVDGLNGYVDWILKIYGQVQLNF